MFVPSRLRLNSSLRHPEHNVLGRSRGYTFQLLGNPYQCNVLGVARVVVGEEDEAAGEGGVSTRSVQGGSPSWFI